MSARLQFRRGSAAWWTAANPVLAAREPGYETDTGRIKFGDGVTAWTSLSYFERNSPAVMPLAQVNTLAEEVTSVDITVPNDATYESLRIIFSGTITSGAGTVEVLLRFNGDTAANYDWQYVLGTSTAVSANSGRGGTGSRVGEINKNADLTQSRSPIIIDIPLHRMTGGNRTATSSCGANYGTAAGDISITRFLAIWRSTANITSVTLAAGAGSFAPGTQITAFGVKAP